MKTAQTIAAQQNAERTSVQKPKRKMNPRSLENLVAPWTKETKPLSPGRPKDRAAEIARRIFEANEEQVYRSLGEKLLAGDAYAFSVLADRGYGKLKQTQVHTGDEDGGPINACLKVEFVDPSVNNGDSGSGEK